MEPATDKTCSEITIFPDGRVFVLGMSEPILDILQSLQVDNERLLELRRRLHDQHSKRGLSAGRDAGTGCSNLKGNVQ